MTAPRRLPALGYAVLIESALLVLAAFGGPHGGLGAVPWVLQLPGIVLVLYPTGGSHFMLRVIGMFLIQLALWYAVISALRRRPSREGAVESQQPRGSSRT
jgi:hypothetical protein